MSHMLSIVACDCQPSRVGPSKSHTAVIQVSMDPQHDIDQLFQLVDQDGDGVLCFAEVTALFQQLAPQKSQESAENAAIEALLLSDRDIDASLNQQEFQQLLIKVAQLSGVPLPEAAHRLLDVTRKRDQPPPTTPPPDILLPGGSAAELHCCTASAAADTAATAAATTSAKADTAAADTADTAAARDASTVGPSSEADAASAGAVSGAAGQLRQLFELWDKAGDGSISFSELCHGLSKMRQPIKHKQDMMSLITEAGSVLAAHDTDGDRQLSYQEFTAFMSQFMAAAGFQLPEVLQELIILAQTKPDSEKLQKVLDAAQPQIQHMLSNS